MTSIDQRATTPVRFRELAWIRGALQTAIALEHATMPLYTAAMYSLEVQNYPCYNAIRSVLMEEMLHMAAASNILAALGGSPRIKDLRPGYPGAGLPGQVAPDLVAVLAPLSRRQLANFMRIEAPLSFLTDRQRAAAYPTVGSFYGAIRDAVRVNAADVRLAVSGSGPANQVGGNLGYRTIGTRIGVDPVEEILDALDMITHQGEGDGGVTAGAASAHELSHYIRFAEQFYGRALRSPAEDGISRREDEPAWFCGPAVAWPVVINTLAVPSDGYAAVLAHDPDAAAVTQELTAFDAAYTEMMAALDDAWNGPPERSWPSLGEAVIQMNEMRVLSCFNIMRYEVPPGVVPRLPELYPSEYQLLADHTDLTRPVFYGPRFANLAAPIAARATRGQQ